MPNAVSTVTASLNVTVTSMTSPLEYTPKAGAVEVTATLLTVGRAAGLSTVCLVKSGASLPSSSSTGVAPAPVGAV